MDYKVLIDTCHKGDSMGDNRDKVIYVSGLYTTGDISENIALARKYAIKIWEEGFTALTPHLNTAHFEEDCSCMYSDYIDGDIVLVNRCDGVFMLPNWELSNGARIERDHAKSCGFPVFESWENLIRYEW